MKKSLAVTYRLLAAGLLLAAPLAAAAQKKPAAKPAANALSAIREADIKRDLFALAGDHFRGREGGTLDELKASVWLADQIRATGMLPAGDDGTYFQWFNLQRTRLSKNSTLRIGTHEIKLNEDGAVTAPTNASITAPLVYVGTGSAAEIAKVDVKGKAVAVQIAGAPTDGISYRRYVFGKFAGQAGELVKAGAVAVVFVSDAPSQALYDHWSHVFERGRYSLPGAASTKVVNTPPVIWLPASAASWVQQAGQQFSTELKVESFQYPSVNIVAKMPGTDAQLKKEYVLFSTHQDHDGVRAPIAGDSIYNGADDNATGCAALLAIMRAFKQQPARRSALFVYQGAEERGLIGSTYFSAHPTVPQSSIVAVLNAEMMGRNVADSAALLGSTPPAHELLGPGENRPGRQPGRPQVQARHRVGQAHPPRGLVLPLRPPALRPPGHPGHHVHLAAARRLPHPARRAQPHRLRQAHAHDQLDVPHRLGRGQPHRAARPRARLQAGAVACTVDAASPRVAREPFGSWPRTDSQRPRHTQRPPTSYGKPC